jgi:dUTP pyrophosphatase
MKVNILRTNKDLPLPKYAHFGDAGMDLYSEDTCILEPGESKVISTGIKLAIPLGHEIQIRPRSGLAAKHGITVLNTPGTIDHQYRGMVGVILINHGKLPFTVNFGERIAQMVFNKEEQIDFEEVEQLDETIRGEGGFGSTGHK